jgi:23S rRNA (guanosine2251-2'-O)-methyltransferase
VLRSAECLGVSGAIWSWNRGASLTPAVTKVSMGASELVPIVQVANLAEAVRRLKQADFWVVASAVHGDAVPLPAFDFPARTALILGSEGEGIQPLLLKEADFTVHIPMTGRLESLNVAQAATVFLYEWSRRHAVGSA